MTDDEITRALHGDDRLYVKFIAMVLANLLIHVGRGDVSLTKAELIGRGVLATFAADECSEPALRDLLGRVILHNSQRH